METRDKLKVFLVDDDYSFTHYMKKSILMSHTGKVEISTYCTGEDCLINLDIQPDLIILDYHLNGIEEHAMNGMEILKRIKRNLPETKVLLVSSQKKPEVMMDTFRYGAEEYFNKTVNSLANVSNWISYLLSSAELKELGNKTKRFTFILLVLFTISAATLIFSYFFYSL
jgi:two-component system OmpR family response regulator